MCDGGVISGPTVAAIVSAAAATTGGVMSYKASQNQQQAANDAQLSETKRQGNIMQGNMRMQDQQRQDAERSRGKFREETLPAFTRRGIDADQASEQSRLQTALSAAGQRALTPTTGDAAGSNASVQVSGGSPAAPSNNSQAYQAALVGQLAAGQEYSLGQSKAQAAMAALTRAHQLGGERLQTASQSITLRNAKLAAYNRAIAANGLYSGASSGLYGVEADKAANAGAGLALAGSSLSTLGNAGYSYASAGKQS